MKSSLVYSHFFRKMQLYVHLADKKAHNSSVLSPGIILAFLRHGLCWVDLLHRLQKRKGFIPGEALPSFPLALPYTRETELCLPPTVPPVTPEEKFPIVWELVSLVAADDTWTRLAAAGIVLNKDCNTEEFVTELRFAGKAMGPRGNCDPVVKVFKKEWCVWTDAGLPAEETAVERLLPFRRPPEDTAAAEMKRLWPFLNSTSRSRPLLAFPLCCKELFSEEPPVRMFNSLISLLLTPDRFKSSPFMLPRPSSCLLFKKGFVSETPKSLLRWDWKLREELREVTSEILWGREAPSIKLCKPISVVSPPLYVNPFAAFVLGLSPSVPEEGMVTFFLACAVILLSMAMPSSEDGLKANSEFWLRDETACKGLSVVLVRLMSDIGEKVDFHLLLFMFSLVCACFLPAKLPPGLEGRVASMSEQNSLNL